MELEDLDTKRVIGMIALSLYLGFQNVETDDLAHVAGVVIGFFLAALIYRRPKGDDLAGAGKGGERYEG